MNYVRNTFLNDEAYEKILATKFSKSLILLSAEGIETYIIEKIRFENDF